MNRRTVRLQPRDALGVKHTAVAQTYGRVQQLVHRVAGGLGSYPTDLHSLEAWHLRLAGRIGIKRWKNKDGVLKVIKPEHWVYIMSRHAPCLY
jgi:hypothetical protein